MFFQELARKLKCCEEYFVVTGGGSSLGQASLALLESARGEEMSTHVSVYGSQARALGLPRDRAMECRQLSEIRALPKGRRWFEPK